MRPEQLVWARKRAGLEIDPLSKRFPMLEAWESGVASPSLRQLEAFAKAVHVPLGYLFLPEPPDESIPIPDFRRMTGEFTARPSPDLLDTIYLCQQRQDWYREFARASGLRPLPFIGSVDVGQEISEVAASIRLRLGLDLGERRDLPTWTEALRRFLGNADSLGILVMVSGVVGANNHRKLDPREFRGFAITDELAPLVFINGADTKAAQMFTLAHELAHLWLGRSALSNAALDAQPSTEIERWCDGVAAELLVPMKPFNLDYHRDSPVLAETARLAKAYKVSSLVILRRMRDAGGLDRDEFRRAYQDELDRLMTFSKKDGGDFYRTLDVRVSKSFARAVVASALEGRSSFTEAFRMLGLRKMSTFQELGRTLGLVF